MPIHHCKYCCTVFIKQGNALGAGEHINQLWYYIVCSRKALIIEKDTYITSATTEAHLAEEEQVKWRSEVIDSCENEEQSFGQTWDDEHYGHPAKDEIQNPSWRPWLMRAEQTIVIEEGLTPLCCSDTTQQTGSKHYNCTSCIISYQKCICTQAWGLRVHKA